MDSIKPATIRVKDAIGTIPAHDWDRLANPDSKTRNPFLSHAFLYALEESGCVGARTGWVPQHLVIEKDEGDILGAMPVYLKFHSRGEYVFDYGWANAFEQAGGRYYPKLQSSVPFTPVPGKRLLTGGNPDPGEIEALLLEGAIELVGLHGASSLHVTFLTDQEWSRHGGERLLQRTDQQFHWENEGYESFDAFLQALASRKRKSVRKERREAAAPGFSFEHVQGRDITEAHWDAFFEFYQDTGNRKWGTPYLNRRFFSLIGETMPESTLLIFCKREGRPIAGALNMIGGDTLYGRYWGAVEHHPFLHFETCYYQAIEYAIAHGMKRVEAGAQGEHKLARGYLPRKTYSLHYLGHPGLRRAVADFLAQERKAVAKEIELLSAYAPFKKDCG